MFRYLLTATGETIQDNPSIAAGTCVFVVAFSLVAANALYSQKGGHPGPIWATRDAITTQSVEEKARARQPGRATASPLTLDKIPIPIMRPQDTGQTIPASSLVREAQSHLAALGYYGGTVDGLYGPKTRDAIAAFEKAYGFEISGQVSTALLKDIGDVAGKTAKPLSPAEHPIDRVSPLAAADEQAPLRRPETDAALVARVQIGLINFGEVEVAVDGVLTDPTVSAVRRFQERYRLPVTGIPDSAIVRKLEDIGALSKS